MIKNRKAYFISLILLLGVIIFTLFLYWYWIFGRPFYPLQKEKIGINGTFTLAAEFPEKFTEGGGVACNNKFYVLSGINEYAQTHNTFAVYDIVKDHWTKLPDLPVKVNHPNITAYGNKISSRQILIQFAFV